MLIQYCLHDIILLKSPRLLNRSPTLQAIFALTFPHVEHQNQRRYRSNDRRLHYMWFLITKYLILKERKQTADIP